MNLIYPSFEKMVTRVQKETLLKQRAKVIWYTGLSGSGKTTLATALENSLFQYGFLTQILDGDNIRAGINSNLGFSEADREENIRRIAEVAKLFVNCGIITICAFVSPVESLRNLVKEVVGEENYIEIFVSTPIEVCEARDTKGLYAKARAGLIKDFTGINAPFEAPKSSTLEIDTTNDNIQNCNQIIFDTILPLLKP